MKSLIGNTQIIAEKRFIELSEEPENEELREMLNKGFEKITKIFLNRMPDEQPEESGTKRFKIDTGSRNPSKIATPTPDQTSSDLVLV